jgi:colicin import membrane protein
VETETVTALTIVEQLTPMQLFSPEHLNPILERIKAEARAVETDISTPDGRKAIASLAYKIARTKTFIDEQRVKLVADRKRELAAVDSEGRRVREELDALKDEIRQPLTEWEESEKSRTAENEARISTMHDIATGEYRTFAEVDTASVRLDRAWDHNFQEFTKRANGEHEAALLRLGFVAKVIGETQAEIARQKQREAEEAERIRIEREAKIAEDARLKAETEAKRREEAQAREAKAREDEHARIAAEEKSRLEREKLQAEERARKAEADRIAAERRAEADRVKALADKEAATRKAEADRKAAEKKAEDARVAAEKKAESDRVAAVEAERKRQDDARIAEENERFKREQDKAHRAKVNREALDALTSHGIEQSAAIEFIQLVAKKLVTHITIHY